METATMGRVLAEATIENLGDLWGVEKGFVKPEEVRRVTVQDALVDTGSTLLAMQKHLIDQLGLTKKYEKRVGNTTGMHDVRVYGTVRLTIQGRDCPTDVMELPDDLKETVLIGQIPLEYLDFVVDPKSQRLIGNPRHDGEWMFDMY